MPPNYLLEQMLHDAMEQEVIAVRVDDNLVGTFTLEMTTKVPLSYIK